VLEDVQSALGASYRVERALGIRGACQTFLATERALGRRVVIKVLSPEVANTLTTARFQREGERVGRLQHPHIIPVLTAGSADALLYYVTPFVEGETLRHRLDREGALPVADARRILRELASALAYAHGRGFVHHGIAPENILLANGLAVLSDFGISALCAAHHTDVSAQSSQAGTAIGAPDYMSPELAAGVGDVDGRSDLYALGVVGHEMLAGQRPFVGNASPAFPDREPARPDAGAGAARDDVPPELAALIERLLARERGDRLQSAGALQDALWQSGTISGKRTAPSEGEGTGTVPRAVARRGAPLVAAVVVMLLLASVGALWLRRAP